MKHLLTIISIFMGLTLSAKADNIYNPEGYWLASKKHDVVIHITRCENSLCGKTYWVEDNDPKLCERKVLWGVEQNKKNKNLWENGTIYKADKDEYYSADITFKDPDHLLLRGYLGFSFLGKDYNFERVNQKDYPACAPDQKQLSQVN